MKTVLLAFLLLSALVVCSKSELGNPHIVQISPRRKSEVPPSIRKCMAVRCYPGYYCFFGRCVQSDPLCESKKCRKGQRCVRGHCLEQLHTPRKQVCPPLGFTLERQRCSRDLAATCSRQALLQTVCGFNKKTGDYFDFSSPCLACSDRSKEIDFYYETACLGAPRICNEEEECLNGVCSDWFAHPAFANARSCNAKADCEGSELCVGHKCIERADLFNFMEAKAETEVILVKI